VLSLSPETRIFMAAAPIDMRRSFDGLCATVIEVLELNPLEGQRWSRFLGQISRSVRWICLPC